VFCNTLRIQEEHVLKVKNKYLRTVNIKKTFLYFHFFSVYIYNTILCIILCLHKIKTKNELMLGQKLGNVNIFLLTAVINLF